MDMDAKQYGGKSCTLRKRLTDAHAHKVLVITFMRLTHYIGILEYYRQARSSFVKFISTEVSMIV